MRTNQDFKNAALSALKGSWPQAVIATFVILLLFSLSEAYEYVPGSIVVIASSVISLLVLPVVVGYVNSLSRLYYQADKNLFHSALTLTFNGFFRSLLAMFLMSLVVAVLTLLLIVPGVIASMAFYLTPYLLKDNPELSIIDTLRLSRKMMRGHKMQLFCLQMSFIGWILLSMLTLGIGMLWLMPYMMTTMAAFYQDVREQYIMKEGQQESAS